MFYSGQFFRFRNLQRKERITGGSHPGRKQRHQRTRVAIIHLPANSELSGKGLILATLELYCVHSQN